MAECASCEKWIVPGTAKVFEGDKLCAICYPKALACNCEVCGETYVNRDALLVQGVIIQRADGATLQKNWGEVQSEDSASVGVHIGCVAMWLQGHLARLDSAGAF